MTKKIQMLSDLNGKIMATCEQSERSSKDKASPRGCTLVSREGQRLDVVTVAGDFAKLSKHELLRKCELRSSSHSSVKLVKLDE